MKYTKENNSDISDTHPISSMIEGLRKEYRNDYLKLEHQMRKIYDKLD
jgi:hypothetical protein